MVIVVFAEHEMEVHHEHQEKRVFGAVFDFRIEHFQSDFDHAQVGQTDHFQETHLLRLEKSLELFQKLARLSKTYSESLFKPVRMKKVLEDETVQTVVDEPEMHARVARVVFILRN